MIIDLTGRKTELLGKDKDKDKEPSP